MSLSSNSPSRKDSNLDLEMNNKMGKTAIDFKDKHTVSSDAKTRYRFGMFTPTSNQSR